MPEPTIAATTKTATVAEGATATANNKRPPRINETLVLNLKKEFYAGKLPSQVASDFECGVCTNIVFQPLQCTFCEMLFCKICLD